MNRKTSSLLIGLFVVGGVLLGMIAVIWLGVSRYFQEGAYFTTYFDESVQGLSPDSPVRYRGVEVGHVESIQVAPDNRLVEVVMRVNLSGGQECEAVAQLKTAGLTGLVFVELDQLKPADDILLPGPGFTPQYPVIPSRLSAMQDMMRGLNEILAQVKEVDFRGISDRTKTLLDSAGELLADGRAESLMEETRGMMTEGRGLLAEARGEMGRLRLAERVDRAAGDLEAFLETGRGAAGEAASLLVAMREELAAMQLAETTARTRRLAEELDQRTRHISVEMRDTTADLRRVMETLDRLLERLNANPSDILFSRPPAGPPPMARVPGDGEEIRP
jgi:phospholipid/cholesterol/gamma-HCH transport system substrate-binding protein